ncbi:hypothetical protein [Pseudomonas sp. PMCC200344]|uniref:hypothetical protein n=1 Tax=Pseudomonas sp. PMCC200344 TaxID=3042028 RepID=UPI0024B38E72|nr:hypothetical protein [Pseudomonas sp. PMCC200344]
MLMPLMILEAVDDEIKLTAVPNGATAHIPQILDIQEGDIVKLYVGDVLASELTVAGDVVFPIVFIVSRQMLLGFVEQAVDFEYTVVRGANYQISPPARYRISHS